MTDDEIKRLIGEGVMLLEKLTRIGSINAEIARIEADAKASIATLRSEARELSRQVALDGALLDNSKISLARTILVIRGQYANGGDDRASVVQDAIRFFVDGPRPYKDLRNCYFGTKSYDRWFGQRHDGPYGTGPTYGSTIFSIGLLPNARSREAFAPEELEACLYFLTRLEKIQSVEGAAA